MRRALLLAAIVATAFAWARSARANEADAYGLGSRSSALAGAVTADATDFSANYYNPASLASSPGVSLAIGYTYNANHLSINGQDNGVASAHGLVGGIVAAGKFFGVPVAFGLGTFLPDDGLSHVQALHDETPRWALYQGRASILYLAANIAVKPLPWLELGGGLGFLAATRGTFDITGKADALHPYNSQLRHQVDADLTEVRYPELGARVKVGDLGFVGVTYRGESKLKLDLEAHLQGTIDFAGLDVPLVYDLSSQTVDAFLPQQLAWGVSVQKVKHLHVNVDLVWVNWAAYEAPTPQSTAHLQATLPPGAPVTLPQDPKPTQPIPPSFSNRFVPRVGVEWIWPAAGAPRKVAGETEEHRLIEVPLRIGYAFERSPVPPQTGVTNFVDCDRHTIAIGTGVIVNAPGVVLPGALRVDVHLQASVLPERVTHKDDAADFVGDYRASGTMLGGGAVVGASF